jgi:hypothetical protein
MLDLLRQDFDLGFVTAVIATACLDPAIKPWRRHARRRRPARPASIVPPLKNGFEENRRQVGQGFRRRWKRPRLVVASNIWEGLSGSSTSLSASHVSISERFGIS